MRSFLYSSRCRYREFDDHESDILRTSIANNASVGISGFLFRSRTHYFQCIEGNDGQVGKLIQKIFDDDRHFDIVIINDRIIDVPNFADWSMGYSDSSDRREYPIITRESTANEVLEFLIAESNKKNRFIAEQKARNTERAEIHDFTNYLRDLN